MNILIVTQTVDSRNPLLGFFIDWLCEFSRNFDEVNVICLYEGEYSLPANVHVFSLGKEKGVSKISYILNFYRLIFKLRNKYDAVFVHMNPVYMLLGGIWWRLWAKRTALWYTHKNVDLKLRIATFFAHRIFSASKESFRIETPKLIVTGHGIMTDKFDGQERIQSDVMRLVTVGRISKVKQTKKCVEILELVSKNRKAELLVVGDASTEADVAYKTDLIEFVSKVNLTDKVRFTGSVPNSDIPAILRGSDIMVHTSQTGSVDKVVLEALLSGVLVLTENESFKDTFEVLGMYLENPNVATYAFKISEFADDPVRRNNALEAGKKWVKENHSLKSLIPKIKNEYERISTSR